MLKIALRKNNQNITVTESLKLKDRNRIIIKTYPKNLARTQQQPHQRYCIPPKLEQKMAIEDFLNGLKS
jgi:hypothetical protein